MNNIAMKKRKKMSHYPAAGKHDKQTSQALHSNPDLLGAGTYLNHTE